MSDFGRSLMTLWVDIECPACAYPFQIQMIDARTQVYRRCPCCRGLIHLLEPDGSVSAGSRNVQAALNDLRQTIESFGR